MKKKPTIITLDENEIKKILAKKYGADYKDVHLLNADYEISGYSDHAVPTTRYIARIRIDKKPE